ncbi:MAG: hypothetical protein KJ007_08575 [Burkholderiales bacterium]|nr:hypothetical protein [Burkholderiales bacterium]
MTGDSAKDRFDERLGAYKRTDQAKAWLERNWARVKELFSNVGLRDFVFEPIKEVFSLQGTDGDRHIRQAITMVAIANAVMAGLPGKMGVGVFVSIGLEGWMAYVIATRVGIQIKQPADVWKYFGLLAGVGLTVLYGFRAFLGVAFSLFSVIPGVNPMIFAELLVTNLVGVLFWVGFQEAKSNGSFTIPMRALSRIGTETKGLAAFQWSILRDNLNPTALKQMGSRLKAWLTGEIPLDHATLRGDVATAALMGYLLGGRVAELEGPVGREFIQAIRDRFLELREASLEQIADHMATYDAAEMAGVISLVKGKLFERLVALHENQDDDAWRAVLHQDESYPGSDITLVNDDTGEVMELSLKATDSTAYVEEALLRYPDIPVLTTEEVGRFFANDPRVSAAALDNDELTRVTESNFEAMLDKLPAVDVAQGAAAGVAAGATIGLWPFVVAYMRKRISQDQLEQACVKVFGQSGVSLASRLSYAALLGPLFAWYLLARGVMGLAKAASSQTESNPVRRLVWQPA